MARIPEDTIQEVRDRVDIVDLIGRHVTLKKAGRSYKGLCPFHSEKTPSFNVSPDRGTFHCFGCGEGGNAFGFLMRHENLTFPEAVRAMAAEVGVVVPQSGGGESGVVERVYEATRTAQALYREALASSGAAHARGYLAERGIDSEIEERFGIGFAPDRWDAVGEALRAARVPASVGERAGLLKERERGGHYDLLRNRVVFPIQDVRGRIVAFGGRALGEDQQPKYLNSPETPVFRKREAFYGFPHALEPIRRNDRAVVVEGYFDLIALHRAGVAETLATCGTALSDDHGRNLRRRTRNVVLLFDGDAAGRRAALRALEILLPHGLRVRAAALPSGEDPDDYLRARGPEALKELVDEAPSALDLAIDDAVAQGRSTPEQRADAVAAVVPLLARIQDPTERSGYAERLALATGTREADVMASVRRVALGDRPEEVAVVAAPPRYDSGAARHLANLVGLLVAHPACAKDLEAERLTVGVELIWQELVSVVVEACAGSDAGDVTAVVERRLGAEALGLLHSILSTDAPGYEDDAHAGAAARQISSWFDRQARRQRQQAITDQLRHASPADRYQILRRKSDLATHDDDPTAPTGPG